MHSTKSKNLGRLFRFSKSLPEDQARPRERHIAPSAFSPRRGAEEFLWRRKHVGRRSDRSRKQPKRRAGCRLRDFPRETEARRIFLPGDLMQERFVSGYRFSDTVVFESAFPLGAGRQRSASPRIDRAKKPDNLRTKAAGSQSSASAPEGALMLTHWRRA